MMADRGITLTHTTILRWVQHYLPEFEKRWSRYARPVGGSWRMDETYIKVRGSWVYLYRAVDKAGWTVDFFLSRNRDVTAAKTFLRNAMKNQRTPTKITLDLHGVASRRAGEEGDGRTSAPSQGAIEPILEQSRRTGPPLNQTADSADAGTTRQSPLAESSWRSRSRRVSSRQGSSGTGNRLCRSCGMRRLLLDSLADPQFGKAQPTSN